MQWEELTLPFDDAPIDPSPVAVAEPPRPTSVQRAGSCDISTQCGHCGGAMRPEHAHYRCTTCGQRDSCCDGPY